MCFRNENPCGGLWNTARRVEPQRNLQQLLNCMWQNELLPSNVLASSLSLENGLALLMGSLQVLRLGRQHPLEILTQGKLLKLGWTCDLASLVLRS